MEEEEEEEEEEVHPQRGEKGIYRPRDSRLRLRIVHYLHVVADLKLLRIHSPRLSTGTFLQVQTVKTSP
jgi:hypothetical protein